MKRILPLLAVLISAAAGAQENILSLSMLPNYKEWTTFTSKKVTHLKTIVFYDDPARNDEEVSYVLDLTLPDSVMATGRVLDLVRDSGFVKWLFMRRSLRDIAPVKTSASGQISLVSVTKKEIVADLTIIVTDEDKKKKMYYIGTRTFKKEQ
jgi:hypothetical protein